MKKVKLLSTALLMLVLSFTTFAQQISVKGNVRSSEGDPLAGVAVMQTGTRTGTVTNLDGNFELTVPSSANLEFSSIGFITKVLKAEAVMNVVLEIDNELLDEVVVTGYMVQKKADLTGAVAVVDMKTIEKMNVSNPMQALQGQVAGVNITAGGAPNSSASVQIRGVGTLNGTNPLYIVDGVPTTGISNLNPDDIESIQFLKDASSATIYGSRASNGVIIVTTKKGTAGKLTVTFNSSVAMSNYINQLEILDAEEYGRAFWRASVNDGYDPNVNGVGYSFDWGYDSKGVPVLNKVNIAKYLDTANTTPSANTDWVKETTQTGIVQNYNVALSQGSERGSSYFSVGYYGNQGTIKTSDYQRITTRMNSEYKLLKDHVTVGEHFTLTYGTGVNAPGSFLQSVLQFNPTMPIYTVDGNWAGPVNGYPDRQNPLAILDRNKDNKSNSWRAFGDAYINVNLFKGFNFKTTFGLDYSMSYGRSFTYPVTEGNVANPRNGVTASFSNSLSWMWNGVGTYSTKIGRGSLDLMAGMELNREKTMNFSAYREDFSILTPDYMWPDAGTGVQTTSGSGGGFALVSFFGKVNYNYDNRYLLSLTVRRDGSSRFGKNNRYATFPAVSFGWRVKNESFMKHVDWISDLKLRASWGETGNQNISNNARFTLYSAKYDSNANGGSAATSYDIAGSNGGGNLASGFKRDSLGNDDLKWETTSQTNVGVDFSFLGDRLYGTFDYFYKYTRDILISMAGLDVMGEGHSMSMNAGEVENQGMEFSLGYRQHYDSGFYYDVRANISNYVSKITSLPAAVAVSNTYGTTNGKSIIGRAQGSRTGYICDGIFQNADQVAAHATQSNAAPGRLIFRDINNDNRISNADQDWIYDPTPDFSYGLNFSLGYKNFDFSMYWSGIQGRQIVTDLKKETDTSDRFP